MNQALNGPVTDVVVDLDGVLYPFTKAFTDVHKSYAPEWQQRFITPIEKWDFYRDWGLTQKQFYVTLRHYCRYDNLFNREPPMPNYWLPWKTLQSYDINIHIATSRPPEARIQTIEWLENWGFDCQSLHFTSDKGLLFGSKACIMGIDDHVEHFNDMTEVGIQAYLMTQPWNKNTQTPFRVNSFAEFVDIVTNHNLKTLSNTTERL